MKIKTAINGYIVEVKRDDVENKPYKDITVIQADEDCRDFDPKAVMELIMNILEELGIFISNRKYERENIEIEIKHGTHYECKDKGCEICNG